MSRCRWMIQDGIRFHVPGCWGTVHDPNGPCYCPTAEKTLDDRLDELEARLDTIVQRLEQPQ